MAVQRDEMDWKLEICRNMRTLQLGPLEVVPNICICFFWGGPPVGMPSCRVPVQENGLFCESCERKVEAFSQVSLAMLPPLDVGR